MGLVQSPKECLVCLNSNKTIFVPTEESQKIFNVCCSYVKDAINIEFLINNIIGNNSSLSLCKNCLDCSLNLSQLVEQLSNIKKEISDLSSSFSKTITKQRIEALAITRKREFNHGNSKFHTTTDTTNKHKSSLDSSEGLLLQRLPLRIPISDTEKNSLKHFEASNELIEEEIAINEIGNEIVKTENSGIFLDYEDNGCTDNVSGYHEEEYETNYLVTENEHDIDPFGEIEVEPQSTTGIVNDLINVSESKVQIGSSKSQSELASSVTMPSIVLERLSSYVNTKEDDAAFISTKTSHHDKPGVVFNQQLPDDGDPTYNPMTRNASLKQEKNISSKRRYKYSCSICSKKFGTQSHLKRHCLIHTGEKPYKCDVCEKAYRQSSQLQIHKRTHTGEKPYKCSMCTRSFMDLGGLKYHERTHSNDKPYTCSYCQVAFKHLKILKQHQIRSHTGETPFKCHFCELSFKTNKSRLGHQKEVHPNFLII